MLFPQFVGGPYVSGSPNVAAERCVNFYVERTESATSASPFPAALYGTPGLAVFTSGLRAPFRGGFAQDGRVFVVSGDTLYELNGIGTPTTCGTVATDDEPVSMASNGHGGHQLCVISAGLGYIFDLNTSTLTQITDVRFPANAVMVDFLDGYFIVMQATTSTFVLSALNDGLTWPGDAGQVNSSSDNLRAVRVIQRMIWLFGTRRTEVWVNTGGTFPFAPIPGALIEWGVAGTWALTEADGRIFVVATDERGTATVRATNGYGFDRISTHHQDRALAAVPDLSNVRLSSYQERGHTHISVRTPTGPAQVFDLVTGLWHERGVWNVGADRYDPPLQWCHFYGHGLHLVGDFTSGTVYVQSLDYGTDAGAPIRRLRQAPHVNERQQRLFGSQVTLGVETGLATPADPSPTIDLSWSKDGGHTFSTPMESSLGAGGDYRRLVTWPRCPGMFSDLVLRAETTAQTPVSLFSCDLRLEAGTGQR